MKQTSQQDHGERLEESKYMEEGSSWGLPAFSTMSELQFFDLRTETSERVCYLIVWWLESCEKHGTAHLAFMLVLQKSVTLSIYSCSKYLMSACYFPGTILGAKDLSSGG